MITIPAMVVTVVPEADSHFFYYFEGEPNFGSPFLFIALWEYL